MDHRAFAQRVRVMQPFARLREHAGREPQGLVVPRHRRREVRPRRTLEILHHEEQLAAILVELVDRADVRMRQARRDSRLLLEQLDKVGLAREVRQDPFDRDELLESGCTAPPREIKLGHATAPELVQQLVAT